VSEDDRILALKETDNGYTHAENLHLFINNVLQDAGIAIKKIDCISVSRGPGSYTGLRIGTSSAKGLAYALKKPLVSVDTLMIMASMAISKRSGLIYCPMLDARRMEVYTSIFDASLNTLMPVEAMIVNEASIEKFPKNETLAFFGDGMNKCREILSRLTNTVFIEEIKPSAKFMAGLSCEKFSKGEFENVAYFEPLYLKDFLILKSKKGII
jgi:tRNA threonylcarbamoyladenosine biosynthesis protein TsaB